MDNSMADVCAKQEIYDVLCRYCRGIDRIDMDLVRECYHPDAMDHHVGFDGAIGDFIEWVEIELRKMDGTMHSIANHLIDVNGGVARAETYVNTWSWTKEPTDPAQNSVTGTRYVDRFERRNGVWRIAERWAVRSWIQTGLQFTAIEDDSNGPVGRRDRSDLAYLDISAHA